MSDTNKCKDCQYWRAAWGTSELHLCNYLLDTGKRRVEVNGVCKSFNRKRKRCSRE